MDLPDIALVTLGLALGGVLKGATGAGAPILAIPILALIRDVPFAVTVLLMPNLLSNLWQAWTYRQHRLPLRFTMGFAGAGAAGAMLGTWMLARLPGGLLMLVVAFAVFAYIGFRLFRPGWSLPRPLADRLAMPAGALAGILQGASGLSAPASITFLNAMRLERAQFVATIAAFFTAVTLVQIAFLAGFGLLTWNRLALSAAALIPLAACMPAGAWLARRLSRETFDRLILALLALIAAKLILEA